MPLGLPLAASILPGEHDYLKPKVGFLGRLGGALFPAAPGMEANPKAQQAAMLRLGLGLLARGSEGQGTGQALLGSYLGATQQYQGAMQNAYQNSILKREEERRAAQEERDAAAAQAESTQRSADVVSRAPNLQSVIDSPLRSHLEQIGFLQPAIAAAATPDPADDQAVMQQVQALSTPMMANMAKPPASIAEYQLAQEQGYDKSFMEYLSERSRGQVIDYAGGQAIFDPVSREVTPLTTAQQEATGAATVAEAKTAGKLAAQTESEIAAKARSNAKTLNLWNTARDGLMSGLAGTETGPVAGRVPAVTTGQQIAEGAIAAVAPVLKQLFRQAGEGIFTDKDQELLLAMVPKRTDHPEAREAKMQMIDAIVQAKLSAPPTQATGMPDFSSMSDEELQRIASGNE